jgi:hypothetical protein
MLGFVLAAMTIVIWAELLGRFLGRPGDDEERHIRGHD